MSDFTFGLHKHTVSAQLRQLADDIDANKAIPKSMGLDALWEDGDFASRLFSVRYIEKSNIRPPLTVVENDGQES